MRDWYLTTSLTFFGLGRRNKIIMKHVYIFYGEPASGKSIIGRIIADGVATESVCVIDGYYEVGKQDLNKYEAHYNTISTLTRDDSRTLLQCGLYHFIKHSNYNIFIIIAASKSSYFNLCKSCELNPMITISTVMFSRFGEYISSDTYNS